MSFYLPPHPYPAGRYDGDGEASATYRPEGSAHDIETVHGWCDYLATGGSTRESFGLYRWHMNERVSGPSRHLHRSLSESFFVLAGVVNIYDGRQWIPATPGDYVYVPEGGVHGFRNESGAPATMLILFSPGAPRERYFEGLADLGKGIVTPSKDEMAEFYRLHDTYWIDD